MTLEELADLDSELVEQLPECYQVFVKYVKEALAVKEMPSISDETRELTRELRERLIERSRQKR